MPAGISFLLLKVTKTTVLCFSRLLPLFIYLIIFKETEPAQFVKKEICSMLKGTHVSSIDFYILL